MYVESGGFQPVLVTECGERLRNSWERVIVCWRLKAYGNEVEKTKRKELQGEKNDK
jgi:hypothetical protein